MFFMELKKTQISIDRVKQIFNRKFEISIKFSINEPEKLFFQYIFDKFI